MIRPPRIERPVGAWGHRFDIRVRFGDTDAAGIVYYANYLRYFEAGRAEMMREAGLPYAEVIDAENVVMPVVDTWVRYLAPARYDDLITVESWVHELRAASILVGSHIWRADTLLVSGGVRLGCVTTDGKPRRLPSRMRTFDPATLMPPAEPSPS